MFFSLSLSASALAAVAPRIDVQGHRGCRAVMPENTLAAFNEALRLGVDVLETDMQVTKDNAIVLAHDSYINPERCLGPGGEKPEPEMPFRSLTLEQVKRYDCGSLPNPLFPGQASRPGEKIPALEELFELVKTSTYPAAARVRFNIETKISPGEPELTPSPESFAALVLALVRRYGYEDRVILQSFDKRTLLAMKKLEPRIRTAMLTDGNNLPFAAVAKAIGAEIISPDAGWITPADIVDLHAAGVQVAPWTVNEPAGWDLLIKYGVDAIITDDPAGLVAHLKAKGLR
ncbi:MAG: glycerophosphodiester phosphodiesterase [Elusimicrobiaceae bacterium]|nr:glycerophosphodiester phosphodiesterase [Elusimicrobiaceae bacterium]